MGDLILAHPQQAVALYYGLQAIAGLAGARLIFGLLGLLTRRIRTGSWLP